VDTFISHSPGETQALGEDWGRTIAGCLVIGLSGPLGSGKTQLVKGIARGLGCSARVHSPTFNLINIYEGGRFPLHHVDLYRLDSHAQIVSAGLEDTLLAPEGVTVVEWIERWLGTLDPQSWGARRVPATFRLVRMECLSAQERRLTYEDFGS
jgi:tRNA threonylcarbamoyladenosine biosynthesis protein TsaE